MNIARVPFAQARTRGITIFYSELLAGGPLTFDVDTFSRVRIIQLSFYARNY